MFDNNFKEAEEYLKFAFEHCYVKSRANKRSILIYLIPVKMLLGQMPEEMLLRKYDLLQFKEVVLGVKQGTYHRLFGLCSKWGLSHFKITPPAIQFRHSSNNTHFDFIFR